MYCGKFIVTNVLWLRCPGGCQSPAITWGALAFLSLHCTKGWVAHHCTKGCFGLVTRGCFGDQIAPRVGLDTKLGN